MFSFRFARPDLFESDLNKNPGDDEVSFSLLQLFKHVSQQIRKGGSLETSRNLNKQHRLIPQ